MIAPGASAAEQFTPMQAASQLAGCRGRVLLHSGEVSDDVEGGCYVSALPSATLTAVGQQLTERGEDGQVLRSWHGDPLAAASAFAARHGVTLAPTGDELPRVVGLFSYDLGRSIERLAPPAVDRPGPDLWMAAYPAFLAWDHHTASARYVGSGDGVRRLRHALDKSVATSAGPPVLGAMTDVEPGARHLDRIRRALGYIAAGDVYQVNLARRLDAAITKPGDALSLYQAINAVAPASHGGLIEADGVTLVSGSPERFLSVRGGKVETRPIKGTRPRGATASLDDALVGELDLAEKDSAEHLMIVDLERNDLGRVACTGTVRVDSFGYVVRLPHLLHRVSRISARLRSEVDLAELLRATFPGGSITGAPKVRAMQIIDELEGGPRGPYCGAFGWIGAGALELAIAIRVATIAAGRVSVHVGGGIVADSDPDAEFAETEVKAAGWRAALAQFTPR